MCARVMIWAIAASCAARTPTERERALVQLPADAIIIAAADGPALSQPAFRAVVDAARARLPGALGCVVDAALTSQAVAVAADPAAGATIVVITRAVVAGCPPLSRIAPDLWVATIGGATTAPARSASPLQDPRWARARPYLAREPIALAGQLGARGVVAVAQPAPLDAWVAIDADDPVAVTRFVEALARAWGSGPGTLGARLRIARRDPQVVVRVEQLAVEDLVEIARGLFAALDPPAAAPSLFACPPAAQVVRCTAGTQLVVRSTRSALRDLTDARTAPVFAGGHVAGLELTADAVLLLRRGDIILAVDAHRVTSALQLAELVDAAGPVAAVAVRRAGRDTVVQISQVE